jgi:alkanesulfonate monooxygenase SsuD/methylene tetrahydromethanopterin reductase-like flavin-dependent oxidoreductase (luciferase family)
MMPGGSVRLAGGACHPAGLVAETRNKAEKVAAPAVSYLYRELYGAKSAQGERELRTDDGRVISDRQQATYEALKGRYAIGEPDFVYESLKSCVTELGATEIICWMHMPGIRGEEAMGSGALREGGHAPLLTANHGTEVSAAIFPAVGPLGHARRKSR